MKIVYPPFVNHEGTLLSVTTDLNGVVSLNIKVKGKDGAITMSMQEAVSLLKKLKAADVESLASIYAA